MNKNIKKNIRLEKIAAPGFTLLEVLVALAIFALISITCYRQIDANYRTSERIEKKYLALWVAENKLEEIFIDRKWPLMGETKSDVQIASSRWIVKMNVSETTIKDLRKVEVSVYSDDDQSGGSILTLTRLIGKN